MLMVAPIEYLKDANNNKKSSMYSKKAILYKVDILSVWLGASNDRD